MDESTQTEGKQGTPTTAGYCSWHQRIAENVQRIKLSEAGSGGKVHYACPPCIGNWKLTPYEDQ
ncbi:hypothetical protein [Streptomyces parvulus]|uniref:hypothetical protein n=1 Tax=Streptomyces parvulus TaxID=146923 RepID=UPI003400A373